MSTFTESIVEDATLSWLEGLGYGVIDGPEIAAGDLRVKGTEWIIEKVS